MKKSKSVLAVLLVLLTLAALALPAAAEELVESGEVSMTAPKVGSKCKELRPISSDQDKFDVSVNEVYRYLYDENGKIQKDGMGNNLYYKLKPDDVFEADILYWCRLEFTAKPGYRMKPGADIIIRGQHCSLGSAGTNLCEITLRAVPADPDPQEDLCPYCHEPHTGFFAPLIRFIHTILYRLFGEKK